MTETSADLGHLLEICRRIEFTIAGTYRYLSDVHRNMPDIAAVWRKTADEEENHALQFKLALKLPNLALRPTVDVGAADRLLKAVQDLDGAVRRTTPPVAEALRVALELEKRLAGYHMNAIGVFQDARLQEMFKALMASDKQHVEALATALGTLAPPSGTGAASSA